MPKLSHPPFQELTRNRSCSTSHCATRRHHGSKPVLEVQLRGSHPCLLHPCVNRKTSRALHAAEPLPPLYPFMHPIAAAGAAVH